MKSFFNLVPNPHELVDRFSFGTTCHDCFDDMVELKQRVKLFAKSQHTLQPQHLLAVG